MLVFTSNREFWLYYIYLSFIQIKYRRHKNFCCYKKKCFCLSDNPSVVDVGLQEYHGYLGKSISIACSIALSENQINLVSWMFHDIDNNLQILIRPSSKYEIGLPSYPSLLIHNLTFSDEGLYRCVADYKFQTVYGSWISLSVRGKFWKQSFCKVIVAAIYLYF